MRPKIINGADFSAPPQKKGLAEGIIEGGAGDFLRLI